MQIVLRIYTTEVNDKSSRTITLNEGELEDIFRKYIEKEYLKDSETMTDFVIEKVVYL